MIISTIIHGLEIATALLVVMMTVQLGRCYRSYAMDKDRTRVGLGQGGVEQPSVKAPADALDASVIRVDEASPKPLVVTDAATPVSASTSILDDYIGGFFAESVQPDVQAYRADSTIACEDAANQPNMSDVSVSKEQLASFKAPETIEPVLINPVRVVDLDDEDTFIVVEDDSVSCHQAKANESVMSDKVVMAMLKEANMVASS